MVVIPEGRALLWVHDLQGMYGTGILHIHSLCFDLCSRYGKPEELPDPVLSYEDHSHAFGGPVYVEHSIDIDRPRHRFDNEGYTVELGVNAMYEHYNAGPDHILAYSNKVAALRWNAEDRRFKYAQTRSSLDERLWDALSWTNISEWIECVEPELSRIAVEGDSDTKQWLRGLLQTKQASGPATVRLARLLGGE